MTQMEKNVPKILIVDDVEANRFLLRDMIQDMAKALTRNKHREAER